MQTDSIRKASHAGSWYVGDGAKLNNQLDNWLSKAEKEITSAKIIKGLIGPHAGYTYSGPPAAWAYNYVDPKKELYMKVFVLGPSHHEYIVGCGLSSMTSCQTPLGDIPIDTKIMDELKATGKFKSLSQSVDEQEHSLEMHYPFIYKQFSSLPFKMIPIMVGQTDSTSQEQYGKIFAKYLELDNTFFVISSDFCHWGDNFDYQPYDKQCGEIYQSIEKLDKTGAMHIENEDPKGFNEYLKQTGNTICGRNPIGIYLNAIIQSNLSKKIKTKLVQYAQSSKLTKDGKNGSSSVSYAAFVTYMGD